MIELGKETERVILVGVSLTEQEDTRKSLDELKDLASTAGAETVGTVIQSRDQVHPGTYVGKGKIDEIKELMKQGHQQEALDLCDSINWQKVHNINALLKASEVYENAGRLEDSYELLLIAHDRSPIGPYDSLPIWCWFPSSWENWRKRGSIIGSLWRLRPMTA